MNYDHEAIHKAYPNESLEVVDGKGIFKTDTSCTEPFTINQSLVNAARVELDKLLYKEERSSNGSTTYASFGDQLDMLYKDIVAGKLDTTGTWATHIKAVKDANPKP
tara:strand:+ start:263 stop:583 length:321 start_codon:yes stop_codon:yes gene_type:complete